MDHTKSSLIWNESNVDFVPSLTSTMGRRIWRVETGENCGLFCGFHKVSYSCTAHLISL